MVFVYRFKSLQALRIHRKKQNEYTCQMCSKVFCESHALNKHKQQGCENVNSARESTVALEYDIDDIKMELSEDNIEGIESFMDVNHFLVPIESNILTTATSSNPVQARNKSKSKSHEKSILKTDDSVKYDCYLCNQRWAFQVKIWKTIRVEKLIAHFDRISCAYLGSGNSYSWNGIWKSTHYRKRWNAICAIPSSAVNVLWDFIEWSISLV